VRLFVAHEGFARIGFEREAQVVVIVRRFAPARRNAMHVDIVDRVDNHAQGAQARFFARFAQRRPAHVRIAVDVTAELQPTVEFAMMEQYRSRTLWIDDPGRRGHVAGHERSIEGGHLVRREKRDEPVAHRAFALVKRPIAAHIVQEFARGAEH